MPGISLSQLLPIDWNHWCGSLAIAERLMRPEIPQPFVAIIMGKCISFPAVVVKSRQQVRLNSAPVVVTQNTKQLYLEYLRSVPQAQSVAHIFVI